MLRQKRITEMQIMSFLKIFSDKRITSFEVVTLHLSGMRFVVDYEFVMKDGMAEVSEYGIRFSQDEDRRVLKRRALCAEEEALKLFNDCNLLSWDGFSGKHPKGVLDGTMFRLDAVVNDGRKIHADGSQNFPRHFRELTDWIYNFLEMKSEE